MNEVIDRLLEGNFEYENGSLDFSCSKLELSVKPGETFEGSFRIHGAPGRYLRGYVTSTDGRMECITPEFTGSEEEIAFRFHGDELEEGDVVKGEFCVVSNQGEYYLPFVVNAGYTVLQSSLGNIRNLFHFANLARTSPEEAVSLFYTEDFKRIFNGNDRQYYEYYLGMSAYPGNEQNVEEFLIGINKKQKIEYLTDVSEIRLEDPEGVAEISVSITRNGWGYAGLQIATEGSFLYTEKEMLSDDDFLGNFCRLPVYVDSGLLHDGNNFGSVCLYNSYQELKVTVVVKNHAMGSQGRRRLERKRLVLRLMELYQAFRLKKIGASAWLKESGTLVSKMTSGDEKDVPARLFQAQLLITEERYNEARWILDHAADIMDGMEEQDPVLEAYYLYLTTLIHREEDYVDQVTEQVEHIYKRNQGEWRIAWLLLYLSPEYSRSFSKKWMFLEEQFNRGAASPVLYIEAMQLLNMNPSLLIKLDSFEKQVLRYGTRHGMLHQDVIMQLVYLVQKEREYDPCLYRILEKCYAAKPDVQVLQEICSLLIKGNLSGSAYFEWYQRGIEQELRITKLFEYYLMSVNQDRVEALPKIVLMYFSYQSNLSCELGAFLYANVYRNRERIPQIYANYRSAIEQFVTEQILKRRINRDLAYLYKNLLTPQMLTQEMAEALSGIMFVHQIQVAGPDICHAVVYRQGMEGEKYYPIVDGKAFVSLPASDNTILFEDSAHNRYMASVPHTTEKLMLPGRLARLVSARAGNAQDLNIYMCANGREPAEVTEENEFRFRMLLEDPEVSGEWKRAIGIKLVKYYYENDRIRELDEYLDRIGPEMFSGRERGELLRMLVLRGREEKAYEWLKAYGPYDVEPKTLVRLCAEIIRGSGFVEERVLTQTVWYAFRRGKYDDSGLRYLALYYRGLTRDLRDIWKAAEAFSVDTYELCERMLIQMLFSGSFVGEKMDIFRSYVAGGAKAGVEEAFLSQCAYEYFVKDRITDRFLFEEMTGMHKRGESLHMVCKLAYIKHYAEHRQEMTEEVRETVREFLHEMLRERIHLKMFAEFMDLDDPCLNRIADRTIVEYKAHPEARAIMHYCLEAPEGEESAYLMEEMTEVTGGVCFKEFVLFFGERLQYYIMEERDGSEQLTESATLQKSDTANGSAESKFSLINDLSISNTLQDYNTVDKLLAEYEYKEFMRNGLFRLL